MVFIDSSRRFHPARLLSSIGLFTITLLAVAPSTSAAALVDWGSTLDGTLIGKTGSVTYSNVNGEGYDIVIRTQNLSNEGTGNFGIFGNSATSWWFEGQKGTLGSSISFRFYETGTTTPTGITGVHFRLEDAEIGEQFANFGYWNPSGVFQLAPHSSAIFAGSSHGATTTLPTNYLQNNAPYSGGTQMGKALDFDLSAVSISGFQFTPLRASSSAGSVEMTGLGNLQRADAAIPEPDTALFGLAILGAIAAARRRAGPAAA